MKRIGQKEREYVLEVLDSQFRASAGSNMTNRLEKAFADRIGVKYAIAHVNGTATMHSALVAAGVGAGDEVIVPALTMASTSLVVLHANAVPVFVDIDPNTFNIDPSDIRRKITPYTKAIIPVALYGLSPDMDQIMDIAGEHKLAVIEDDAECFLGYYKGKIVGTMGHMASFSFQSSKHLTCGEGGMVTTNDEALANKIRRFNSLGYAGVGAAKGKITKDDIQDPAYARHVSLGFNYRLPELCSAVALAQVERMDELVEMRKAIANMYSEAVSGCSWLTPQEVPEGCVHSYWTYVLKLETDLVDFSWYDFRKKYVGSSGDGIYAAWKVNYLEPIFKKRCFYPKGCPTQCSLYKGVLQRHEPGLCPNAEMVQQKLLQFKTNYMDEATAKGRAETLARTIDYFGR